MAHQTNNVKQFLDKAGVEALWERIYNGFAPRWQSYKPSNTASSDNDKLPADFINTYESDYIVNGVKDGRKSLDVTFVSAGAIKDANGNKYGRDLIVQIPEVKAPTSQNSEDGKYGVMSPADKWKLDNVANTAEDKVTIKGVKVDGSPLTLTDKFVNWKLNYDTSTNELQIVDLNSSSADGSAVLSRVDMDSILPDVITKGFLQSAEITNTNNDGDAGLFLKLTFATSLNNGTVTNATDVYISINDLVDIYEGGEGISVTQSTAPTADGEPRTSTINLKTAQINALGGVKVYKDNSEYTVAARTSVINANVEGTNHRNFGVEIDKDDKAFVNVPITNITINDPNPQVKAATISPVTGGSFDIITDYNANANVDGWTITPTTATITVNKETNWSTAWPQVDNKDVTGDDNKTLEFGKPFKVFKDIVAGGTNGHGTVKSVATLTMPTETTLSLPDATKGTDNNIKTEYTNTTEKINDIEGVPVSHQSITITTSMVKSVDNHTIVRETTDNKFDICIPAIEIDFINSLIYQVQ